MGANGDGSYRKPEPEGYRFVIPVLPPSVNALHNLLWTRRRVELKPEVVKWKNDAAMFVPRITLQSADSIIRVDTVFHYRFHYANGKLRIFDSHNCLKPMLDLIAAKAGFNDNRVKCGSWDSVDSADEKVIVTLREVLHGSNHD